MKVLALVLTGIALAVPAAAQTLPLPVREAIELELAGRLGEALDRYRVALASEPSLVQDETLTKALTVRVLAKAAHLSVDLGYGEEAWDLSSRLMAFPKNQRAFEAGTLVRMRIYRLQEKWTEASALLDNYIRLWSRPVPGTPLAAEVYRMRAAAGASGTTLASLAKQLSGPAAWVVLGDWSWLTGPTEALGLPVQESVRLSLAAFKDWGHALTLIDMLREKGWTPFTDVKVSAGEKLYMVYVISRQPAADRARLEAQGLIP